MPHVIGSSDGSTRAEEMHTSSNRKRLRLQIRLQPEWTSWDIMRTKLHYAEQKSYRSFKHGTDNGNKHKCDGNHFVGFGEI